MPIQHLACIFTLTILNAQLIQHSNTQWLEYLKPQEVLLRINAHALAGYSTIQVCKQLPFQAEIHHSTAASKTRKRQQISALGYTF